MAELPGIISIIDTTATKTTLELREFNLNHRYKSISFFSPAKL